MADIFCPCCGTDLRVGNSRQGVGLRVDPTGDFIWNGSPIRLTNAERVVLGSLLQAKGGVLSKAALRARLESDAGPKIIDVLICKIRRKFLDAGHSAPIHTARGMGYKWASAYSV
jgi:DNA-binding response OmpR family regulator